MWRKSNPFDDLSSIFRSFDNLFRQTFGDLAGVGPGRRLLTSGDEQTLLPAPASVASDWLQPAVEVFKRENEIVVRAEVPGVEPENLNVSVQDGQLVIRGEKSANQESREQEFYVRELQHGRFERSFSLPEGVIADQLKATYRNGMLEITMPSKGLKEIGTNVPIEVKEGKPSKRIA